MFFRFRPTPGGILSARWSSSALALAGMEGSFACCGVCSTTYSRRLHTGTICGGLLRSPDPARTHRWVRREQLTDNGNVEITGRDLRERESHHSYPCKVPILHPACY